jgi:adenine/guanine phosphoribosyltransferase-like PRPP-binding protein
MFLSYYAEPYDYSYMGRVFDPQELSDTVKLCKKALQKVEFDSFVFRGTSGLVVGAPLALQCKKPFGVVHKPGGHSDKGYKGFRKPGRYVIVDDFIESGATMRKILRDKVLKERGGKCVAILLYCDTAGKYDGDLQFNGIPLIIL